MRIWILAWCSLAASLYNIRDGELCRQLSTMQRCAPILLLLGFFSIGNVLAAVTWTATPFNPGAVPLAVRSPYLSCWLDQGTGQALNEGWPTFWTGMVRSVKFILQTRKSQHIAHLIKTLGWAGYVRVDDTAYNFMGTPTVPATTSLKANQTSFEVSDFSLSCTECSLT